ncbi:MAG TPA: phosphoribosyltransferase family protein [Magnetospirillaceae bacterium]|nr:phosphoribosyltransferase family protein [Magnetospirillaceae bacterium]
MTSSQLKEPPFTRIGLRTITRRDGTFVYDNGAHFNAGKYSRFKHGDNEVAAAYAGEMADLLESQVLPQANDAPVVVTASAYRLVPTAARSVAQMMYTVLLKRGHKIDAGRIHRPVLTNGDYAGMSEAERRLVMNSNGVYIDYDLFVRRHVVVIDDIRITGNHERSIVELFRDVPILSLTHTYVVQMDPDVAADPKVEEELNQWWVKGLDQLIELIVGDSEYTFNARTVKMILEAASTDLTAFLRLLTNEQLEQLYRGVIGDGYNRMSAYNGNFPYIREAMEARSLIARLI